jgi:DNA processing protein
VARLHALVTEPVAAVVGSQRASDYGVQIARSLGRELAAAGVTVACGLVDGIAAAALAGAVDAGGAAICALPGGVDVLPQARTRPLHARLTRRGCAVSELPCGSPPRRWGQLASQRVIAGLAQLTVLVEAEDSARELAPAWLASALGRAVAAVPGRVTSPLAAGPNALLANGATVVRGAADVLELLFGADDGERPRRRPAPREIEPRLRRVLALVSAGSDTPDRLRLRGQDVGEVLCALSELELMGLLARGDGGRYVPLDRLDGGRDAPSEP